LCSKKGFTLIEVMVAMVVLLIGMLGVMAMQYYAISGNTASREMRIGTNLSREIIEQLKSTPYVNLATGGDQPLLPAETTISAGVTFTRAWWVIQNCVGLAGGGTRCAGAVPACSSFPHAGFVVPVSAIQVRTCWTDKDGTPHSVTLNSLRWDENVVP
jgi:prepilin-type N-terminal cleavage/methylation domain-containing protein